MTNQITNQWRALSILFIFGSIIFLAATWNFEEYPPSRLRHANDSQAA
jgi:hypothetical protein